MNWPRRGRAARCSITDAVTERSSGWRTISFARRSAPDVDAGQVRDCKRRLSALANVQFASIEELRDPRHTDHYDAVVCMEVLEHCPSDIQPHVLADLDRMVRPHGVVVISVPIEIGPTLAVKQMVRAVAAATGLSEYAQRASAIACRSSCEWCSRGKRRKSNGRPPSQ